MSIIIHRQKHNPRGYSGYIIPVPPDNTEALSRQQARFIGTTRACHPGGQGRVTREDKDASSREQESDIPTTHFFTPRQVEGGVCQTATKHQRQTANPHYNKQFHHTPPHLVALSLGSGKGSRRIHHTTHARVNGTSTRPHLH